MIDSDHKKLISLVNDVESALRAGDLHVLSQAFNQLWDCVHLHFMKEEKIARAVNFPIDEHKLAHRYLQKELQHIKDELEEKCGVWSEGSIEHFARFLGDWLIEHITGEDFQMKPVLQTYPYDFEPG